MWTNNTEEEAKKPCQLENQKEAGNDLLFLASSSPSLTFVVGTPPPPPAPQRE